jgi:hypothetical protein
MLRPYGVVDAPYAAPIDIWALMAYHAEAATESGPDADRVLKEGNEWRYL